MAAGYSGRSAADKLGVKSGSQLALIDAPAGWTLAGLPPAVRVRSDLRGHREVTVVFARSTRQLVGEADRYQRALGDDASLWIAWPRKAAGHDSDVTENLLRDCSCHAALWT